MNSKQICTPLNMFDCSIDNDGAYALVVASEEVARNSPNPVWILGGAAESYYSDFYASIPDPWFPEEGGHSVRDAANRAFAMSGVSRDEVDVANLYDCFSITMARDLEEMGGFCGLGEGVDFVKDGNTRWMGRCRVTPTVGCCRAVTVASLGYATIEVVRQLRGQCGQRQVADAKIGVSLSQGFSVHGVAGVMVLGTEQPE